MLDDDWVPWIRRTTSSPKARWAAATACCCFSAGSNISDFVGRVEAVVLDLRRSEDFLEREEFCRDSMVVVGGWRCCGVEVLWCGGWLVNGGLW